MIFGVAPAFLPRLSCGSRGRRFQPSLRLARRERSGRSRRCAMNRFLSSPPPRPAKRRLWRNQRAGGCAPSDDGGGEVVEDYGHVGLSLRAHPVSFLREDLHRKRVATCAEAMQARDGRWLRRGTCPRPANARFAKGVMFITSMTRRHRQSRHLAKTLRKQRRVILSAACWASTAAFSGKGRRPSRRPAAHRLSGSSRASAIASGPSADAVRGDALHHGSRPQSARSNSQRT